VYSDAKQDIDVLSAQKSLRAKTAEVNFGYQLTPALSTGLGYSYTMLRGSDAKNKYHQVSLGTSYALSKRTDVYLIGAVQKTDKGNVATLNGLDPSSTNKQVSVRAGLRHKF